MRLIFKALAVLALAAPAHAEDLTVGFCHRQIRLDGGL